MSHPRFSTRQLNAFVAVAKARSFRVAGERLSLSSSAVSQLVSDLESAVGLRLLDRTTRSVNLTPAGREFLPSAMSVLKHMQLAQAATVDIANKTAGLVRVAAPMILASCVLPALVKTYLESRPNSIIRIRDASVDRLVDVVSNADADMALGSDQPVGEDVISRPLFKSPWALWCSATHPLASHASVTWKQLRSYPLVVASRDYERTVALTDASEFPNANLTPLDIVDNISTAFGIAAQGMVGSLAPVYAGLLALPMGLVMRPILQPEVSRQICLYLPANRIISSAGEGFAQFLAEQLNGMSALGSG